jgi:hypothetical protein
LQTRPGHTLASHSLSLSLILFVLCTWTQKEGGARGNLAKISLSPSLSLHPCPTPNQHQAAAQESTRTPPARHSPPLPHHSSLSRADADQSAPLETEASTTRQRLQPRQWMTRHTAPIAQPSAADRTACRPPCNPRSDRAEHTQWTPRGCAAFPTEHARFSFPRHTSLHGIEPTSPCHHCPACSSPPLPWPWHDFFAR